MKYDNVPVAATFSKDPKFWGVGFTPHHLLGGNGAYVTGSNQRKYLDWVCGLGAIILGYNNVEFDSRVMLQVRKGAGFSLPTELEYTVAEKLCHTLSIHIPFWKNVPLQVRWVKTGSDACMSAIRLARAATGKSHFLSYGYHGFSDVFVAASNPAHGVIPEQAGKIREIKFNDPDVDKMFKADAGKLAAVIVEHPPEEPDPTWYPNLRALCDRHGALLIMDEVVTGIRYGLGGVCGKYNIKPDLVCIGKALGNGYPIAALVGPIEYMDRFANDSPVFISSTGAGDAVSLAAADAVLDILSARPDYVDYLSTIGSKLFLGLHDIGWQVYGDAWRSVNQFASIYEKAYFTQEMAERGILMNRPNLTTLAHKPGDVSKTIKAATEIREDADELGPDGLQIMMQDKLPTVLFTKR